MKIFLLLLLTFFCLQNLLKAQDASPYFTSYPALTPDGQTLFFSYDGDIWKASPNGGTSMRITSMEGIAGNPRVSPDGKWLAFSNSQFGNYDVYIMPLNGGVIKRLTFNNENDTVDGSSVRLPSWGCYTLDGKNLEQNGVSPDIYVKNTFEDRMHDKDPQIEKAVEEIMKKLK